VIGREPAAAVLVAQLRVATRRRRRLMHPHGDAHLGRASRSRISSPFVRCDDMNKIALFILSSLVTGGTALAGKPTGRVDGWSGPFKDLAAATGIKDTAALPEMPDLPDPLINRVQKAAEWKGRLPVDALQTYVRSGEWHIAGHTAAGWFDSPLLGVEQSHSHCSIDSVSVFGTTRLSIAYLCTVGERSSAEKLFTMLCGVDSKGRLGCARMVIVAHNTVHRGGKDGGSDTIHNTLSCKPTFHDDTIALEPWDRDDDVAPETTVRKELTPCVPETEFPLSAASFSVGSAKSVRFDEAGRWR
jgi:hypothetical protein